MVRISGCSLAILRRIWPLPGRGWFLLSNRLVETATIESRTAGTAGHTFRVTSGGPSAMAMISPTAVQPVTVCPASLGELQLGKNSTTQTRKTSHSGTREVEWKHELTGVRPVSPQSSLFDYEPDLSPLTDAEREVYEAVGMGQYGPREYARRTGRSPGTVGNLLARAREKMEVVPA